MPQTQRPAMKYYKIFTIPESFIKKPLEGSLQRLHSYPNENVSSLSSVHVND